MSLQDLTKTFASTTLRLIRLPLGLLERALPGRGDDREPEREPLQPDPGISDRPTPGEGLKPDPEAPKPRKPAAETKKPAAKKPAAKKPETKKPAAKRPAEKPARATAAEEPAVVEEQTDGLEAATDRAVEAKEDLEQAADERGRG